MTQPHKQKLETKFDAHLADLYYKQRMMLGRDRLYKYVRAHRPDLVCLGLSRRYVMKWLQSQEAHQLFAPAKRERRLQPTVPKEPFSIVALDLIDLASMEHQGYKWALTAVDLFSKKAYAVPLKSKEAVDVMKGLELMLFGDSIRIRVHRNGSEDLGKWTLSKQRNRKGRTKPQMIRHPRHLRSDNGPEFKNVLLTTFLDTFTQSIRSDGRSGPTTQHFSLPAKPQSNGGIERLNGFLKRQLKMIQVQHDDPDWPASSAGAPRHVCQSKKDSNQESAIENDDGRRTAPKAAILDICNGRVDYDKLGKLCSFESFTVGKKLSIQIAAL